MPGFIDTHLHVESSLVTPLEFDRCVLPHGVTTAICDPHEIANVLGIAGIRYFLDCAERTVMDLRVQLSSCVPATAARDLRRAASRPPTSLPLSRSPEGHRARRVHELSRACSPRDPGCLAKLAALRGSAISTAMRRCCAGCDLNGYLAAGIRTDHETHDRRRGAGEAPKGMTVLIREGSVSKDLHALAPLLTDETLALPRASAPTTATRSTSPRRAISTT